MIKTEEETVEIGRAGEFLEAVFQGRTVKKVLLVSPPDVDINLFDYSTTHRGRSNNYPPYGLGVLARHLLQNGYQVKICNLNHEVLKQCNKAEDASQFDFDKVWKSRLADDLEEFQPDIAGVTCLFTVTHSSFVKVSKEIKTLTASWLGPIQSVPLAVGGVHVTHDVEKILSDIPEADFIFLHEAENSFIHFLDVVNGNRSARELSQVILCNREQPIRILNDARPAAEDLNIIPAYELMNIPEYASVGTLGSWYGFKEKGTPIATVLSNRGCRAACTFCNVRTFNGVGVRHRTVESVLDELSILKNEYGVGHFIWLDDDLLHDPRRSVVLFNGMVQRNLQMTWDATNGLISYSVCNEEVVAGMAASGCIGAFLGVESGNPQILKEIRKPGTTEVFLKAAAMLRKYEQINARILLIIGFPGETVKMLSDTIHLAEKMDLDWCNIAILQPWKSTPIYDQMVEKGLLGEAEGTLKTSAKKIAPYNLGPYSRQRAIERGSLALQNKMEDVFERLGENDVPGPEELDDIWFYMNYRLNFHRLLREQRPIKIQQQWKFLKYVHTLTAPDNALVMYFYGFIQKRLFGTIDESLIVKLENRMAESQYWADRMRIMGLSAGDLRKGVFPSAEIADWERGRPLAFSI